MHELCFYFPAQAFLRVETFKEPSNDLHKIFIGLGYYFPKSVRQNT
jgi:hypothetical protein